SAQMVLGPGGLGEYVAAREKDLINRSFFCGKYLTEKMFRTRTGRKEYSITRVLIKNGGSKMSFRTWGDEIKNQKDEYAERKVLPVCFFCNKVPEEGIRSGFFLRGIFICEKCEKELVCSKPEKREEYMLSIAKLRNILFKDDKPR
ncbi:MAG: sigma factor G inhibitor Gin, partial [Peptococcaceae bacterium]|nr:sigma factor G inhibitor Gin [Peptococcaceae bacterium]